LCAHSPIICNSLFPFLAPLRLKASSGANAVTAGDHGTAAGQAPREPAERASLASEGSSPGQQLPGEEASAALRDVEGHTGSVSKREEPEGTEPLPAGGEESSELPSVWREESGGPSPPAPGEDAGAPSPEPAEDSGLAEGSDSSLVEVVEKVHIAEEEHLAEGETGEQVETELLSETVSEGPETKEEETGEAVDSAAATEIEQRCIHSPATQGGLGWTLTGQCSTRHATRTPRLPPSAGFQAGTGGRQRAGFFNILI
ncbi:hypothetical protein EK904_011834, partial [Melospiza melodia maxima]